MLARTRGTLPAGQRGQVIPLTLVFIVAVILSLWVMYDSGELMTEKIRLQNTADNVAYSDATLISRDLNFVAYTNRGMAANQVAIAQLVGLSSLARLYKQLGVNLDLIGRALQYIPYVGQAIRGVTRTVKRVTSEVSTGVDNGVKQIIPINEQVINALTASQGIFHTNTLALVAVAGPEVGTLNDPDARSFVQIGNTVSLLEAGEAYRNWNNQVGGQYERPEAADGSDDAQLALRRYGDFEAVVSQSRDTFTARRTYSWGTPFHGQLPAALKWETRKAGGTDLFRSVDPETDKYKWDWAAMDTAGMYFKYFKPTHFPPKYSHWIGDLPIAWGAAHALGKQPSQRSKFTPGQATENTFFQYGGSRRNSNHWGDAWKNDNAATAVTLSGDTNASFGGISLGSIIGKIAGFDFDVVGDNAHHKVADIDGLRDFYAFRDATQGHDFGPAVITLYVKDQDKIGSEHSLIEGNGGTVADVFDTNSKGTLINNRISAASKAQPYFSRSTDLSLFARHDRRFEHGNLYNPFWQPRLVDLSNAENATLTAAVASGVNLNFGGGP